MFDHQYQIESTRRHPQVHTELALQLITETRTREQAGGRVKSAALDYGSLLTPFYYHFGVAEYRYEFKISPLL
jgi:hypothetical protein